MNENIYDQISKGLKGKVFDPQNGKTKRGRKKQAKIDTSTVLSDAQYLEKLQEDYLWNNPACWEYLSGGEF
ncbi:hypothetical protein Pla110_32920 [Polystyrenella longa]|uniref:Uncharacterized protein n=1 Tax=Polystyrenella longa TaxID=2528007 RepID=A0A518CQR9_9PLAN|nr:hypothetical protein Pla110_32920 [Polystyrenella longa]